MTQCKQQLLCLTALISAVHFCDAATTTKIMPRSQSMNAARQMVGWNNSEWGINRLPQDSSYSSLNLTFAYTRSFKNHHISYAFFGDDLICVCDPNLVKVGIQGISITGSAVPGRSSNDWLADYFGLPRDFKSFVSLAPLIDNFLLDFSFYAGLDGLVDGLYFRIHGPYVNTRWNLNAAETISSNAGSLPGSIGYFQGYFSSTEVEVVNLNRGFLDYTSGGTPTINNDYNLYNEPYCETYGSCSSLGDITWNPLCCSKMFSDCGCGTLTLNGFGELRFILGYNFLNNVDGNYHLGAGLYTGAPTGSTVGAGNAGNYLFEPIIGNGKHWELGGQVTAHHIWWKSDDEENSLGIYFEANVTHFFSAHQTRCFDLCSAGSNSRYMIAQRLQPNAMSYPILDATADTLELEFANEYAPVANLTRRTVISNIAAQGDVAFTLAYQVSDFRWDLGYNFWGRSCEKLCIQNDACTPLLGTWALKGDERVYGFENASLTESLAIKLAVTDSQATIYSGSNWSHYIDYTPINPTAPNNFYADNSVLAGPTIVTLPEGNNPIYTSSTPILIQECDVNLNGTRGISHKLFTHFNWAWTTQENCTWTPYIGMGAEVEFGASKSKCCRTDCSAATCNTVSCSRLIEDCANNGNCCLDFALHQWGIWLKVGSSYN